MVFLVQLRQNSWTYFAGNGAFGAIAAKFLSASVKSEMSGELQNIFRKAISVSKFYVILPSDSKIA